MQELTTRGAIGIICLGEAVVNAGTLAGCSILLVQDEPMIAFDLQRALEAAGAAVVRRRGSDPALPKDLVLTAAVLDARPGSNEHRPIARLLKGRGVPFIIYTTHAPDEVTTVRGAPVIFKPERPEVIVEAVARLLRQR